MALPAGAAIPLPGGGSLPAVSLGTFRARGAEAEAAVGWALQLGYRAIDTASIYKNEAEVGAAMRASGVPREQLFITSKVSPYQQGTEKAAAAVEQSLLQLGTPYLDLMLVHWPGAAKLDASSARNAELRKETWRVLEGYHRRGALRAIGVSNYEQQHLEELLGYAEVAPAVNQIELHPRYQQRQLHAYCRQHRIAVVAYASLGCGQLLGNPTVQEAAHQCGATPAQALLLWGLQQGCAVIPKSVRRECIAEAAPGVLSTLRLSEAALAMLDGLEQQEGTFKYCWDPGAIA